MHTRKSSFKLASKLVYLSSVSLFILSDCLSDCINSLCLCTLTLNQSRVSVYALYLSKLSVVVFLLIFLYYFTSFFSYFFFFFLSTYVPFDCHFIRKILFTSCFVIQINNSIASTDDRHYVAKYSRLHTFHGSCLQLHLIS